MNTLFLFDNSGYIYYQASGNVREPVGMDGYKMWVNVPDKKRVVKFSMSGGTPTPVYEDIPKSELEQLRDENLQLKLAIAELAELIEGGQRNG